jgi:hypothetical protein
LQQFSRRVKETTTTYENNILKGPEVQVHGGKAWTWVHLNNEGKPEQAAITLTDAALNSVPIGNGVQWNTT